jgi:hypothetical protein
MQLISATPGYTRIRADQLGAGFLWAWASQVGQLVGTGICARATYTRVLGLSVVLPRVPPPVSPYILYTLPGDTSVPAS